MQNRDNEAQGHPDEQDSVCHPDAPAHLGHLQAGRERRAIAAFLCLAEDDPVVEELRVAGFVTGTVALLDLVPLLQVAWIDGRVSAGERDVIAKAAGRRRLVFDTARGQLDAWLRIKPPDNVMSASLHALRRALQRLPADAQSQARRGLLDECLAVAGAQRDPAARQHGTPSEEYRVVSHLATGLADA